jgi:TonB family protein
MNRTTIRERGIGIVVSLVFHVAVLFLLIEAVPPVRIYLYRQVADVRIVEPETVFIPRIAGLAETGTAGLSTQRTNFGGLSGRGGEDLSFRGPEDEPQMGKDSEPGVVYLKNLDFGRNRKDTGERFDLTPSPKPKGGFSLSIDRKKPGDNERVEEDTRKDLDFSQYNAPALSSLQLNRIVTKKGGRVPSGQLDPLAFDQLEKYDITPWVKQVVDKIRNNWTLPPIDDSLALGAVKILIIIGRKGNLIAMEILESSDFQAFDETTYAAIRSSAPFPPLPDEYPSERLEAFLVFEFHE